MIYIVKVEELQKLLKKEEFAKIIKINPNEIRIGGGGKDEGGKSR